MELRKGYNKTEIGIIPEDWEVLSIESVFDFYSTSNYSKAEMFLNGEIGCIHYGLIHAIPNSNYNLQKGVKYFVTKEQAKYEIIKEGDVIMVDASEDLIGINKSVELSGVGNKKYISGLHTFLLRDNNSVLVNGYRGAILNSKIIKSQLVRLAVGMKVYGVSKIQLKNVLLPVPTKAEQTAIATALSDADAYISALEKLIEKKRNIKQGAMQQLLKPKKGWVVKKLGEIVIYKNGTAHEKCVVENGDYIIVNSKFISSDAQVSKYSNELLCPVSKDEILMVLSDVPNGKAIAKCFLVESDNKYTLNQRICSLKSINVDPKFLYYLLNRNPYFLGFDDGAKQTNLRNIDVLSCPLSIPLNIEEQIEIATILSDLNLEVELLEKKLSKSKMLKQGMMQDLLTGKIRLI
jgi:type I restriction enzyme S subunit